MKSRSLCYNYEVLEPVKEDLLGEMGMHQNTSDVLYQLLSNACQERDEAREQLKRSVVEIYELRKLLNKFLPSNSAQTSSVVPHVKLENRDREILKGSDGTTIFETNSSAADGMISPMTLFNNASSLTDSSGNLSLMGKSVVQQDFGGCIQMGKCSSKGYSEIFNPIPASMVIDSLVKGKPQPEKGRFLDAVLDTAPLLETLMITGQLPKWRNPPPLRAVINSESAIPSSQILNYTKCSSSSYLESAGKQKRFQ